jgi:hypothetical protein
MICWVRMASWWATAVNDDAAAGYQPQQTEEILTFSDYGKAIRKQMRWDRILRRSDGARALNAVLKRSLRRVDAECPGTTLFLALLASMTPQSIPRIMLDWTKQCCWSVLGPPVFGARFRHPPALMKAADYGLVDLIESGEQQKVAVHPLVQTLVRDDRRVRRHAWNLRVLRRCLARFVPDGGQRADIRRALTVTVPDEQLPRPSWWVRRTISDEGLDCLNSPWPETPAEPPNDTNQVAGPRSAGDSETRPEVHTTVQEETRQRERG